MIALRIEFLAGRFHGNPWDRGTNEGEVDWPPAPWRLLRAIVAGWYRAGAADKELFLALLDRLAEPPTYLLPHASSGHSRHYMPLGSYKNGKPETTLVLDSFVALDAQTQSRSVAYVLWPSITLSLEQRELLERCVAFIGYLGRAESWCSITIVDEAPANHWLERVDLASRSDGTGPTVRRLAAGPSLRGNGLLRALSETTAEMRKARRLVPQGTAWVEYRLPVNFLMVREQYNRPERSRAVFGSTLMRFSLERGTRTPKPPIKDAVVFAELFRAAAIRRLSEKCGEPATLRLAGKAESGGKREGHDHPFFLPFDARGRGEIDGIDVWFPSGCTHDEFVAVRSISDLREHVIYKDDYPVTFVGQILPPRSDVWQSATPIVLDRFPKLRGANGAKKVVDSAEQQIAVMLQRRGLSATVSLWDIRRGIERARCAPLRLDAFRRGRIRKESRTLPFAGATLRFDQPVEGPIVLGSLAHFGLGRFEPANSG